MLFYREEYKKKENYYEKKGDIHSDLRIYCWSDLQHSLITGI